jgi:hypothetical protein
MVKLYEPATVADVEANEAVKLVADVSTTLLKVKPGALDVTLAVPPS